MKTLEEEWQFQYTWCIVDFNFKFDGPIFGGLNTGGMGVGVGGGDIRNVDWVIYLGAYIRDVEGAYIRAY